MGKLVYWMSVSLDGMVEDRDGGIAFTTPDDELERFVLGCARDVGTYFHGRRTYENMASVWPTAGAREHPEEFFREYAQLWCRTPKVVFSKTLREVAHESRLAGSDIAVEALAAKRSVEGDIALSGATLAASFMKLGLIDEYRLFVRPVILGGGKPYFPPLERAIDLTLVETRTFSQGVVLLRYAPAAPRA
jgi:dihydrofolate reductase